MSGGSDDGDFVIRTEDLQPDEAARLYVPTSRDEDLVSLLASKTPLVLEGSRGTGKSMLLRVCEQRQIERFAEDRVLPVYVSFVKSSLLDSGQPNQFVLWMLSRLSSQIVRAIQKRGLALGASRALDVLTGGGGAAPDTRTRLEEVAKAFEESYRGKGKVDDSAIPSIEDFRDAVDDICEELEIRRINVLFDEAAHIFRPEQQRQFFTLFRDLRSPRMTCNAAVYPGVTAYGSTFEGTHDARVEQLSREVGSAEYLNQMRDIVLRQASPELAKRIAENGATFDALAYAVSGNPRILLKTVAKAGRGRMTAGAVNAVIKDFFRNEVWAEHTNLTGRYPGHELLIDWGRRFVESVVIPETRKKNDGWRRREVAERSNVIWVSRDAPEAAHEGLRLLTYTGILSKMDDGIKGTASLIGSRYAINVGCLVAEESNPVEVISELRRWNTIKRFTEFGAASQQFAEISASVGEFVEADMSTARADVLARSVDHLDLTDYQRGALRSLGLDTIGKALASTEEAYQSVKYIGPVRARKMMNSVTAAVLEYLSG